MMRDGGLRALFRKHLPTAMWTSIETGSTGRGIPDSEFCFPGGASGWVEFKQTSGLAVKIRAEQIAWLDRRARLGGRAWIAVRRRAEAGPRRGAKCDELWLIHAKNVMELKHCGLGYIEFRSWIGGPAKWDWDEIGSVLRS